ncbi:MAG: glycosyltransferase family 4 protein [Rubrivivax sp.]|nr:glycosyltransferase family 4 protein [Rubrivivax sp.]
MYTAHFAPQYSGAALQALTLAKELRERGHIVEFMTNHWPGLEPHAVVEGFAVRRLEAGRGRKHRELRLWMNMSRYVWERRADFDILHSHGAYFTNAFVGPLARALGKRSVIKASLASDDLAELGRSRAGRIHRFMLSRIDACVAISRDLVDEFRVGGLAHDSIHFIPNGVDTSRFRRATPEEGLDARRSLKLPTDRPVVLFVGVLDQRKNILWLAQQWIAHRGFGTNALLVAVGPQARDDEGGKLRRQLSELAQANPTHFALHDFHADVTTYYRCADLLVLPSAREGLPNVVLEAMACGLPCAAARTSGSRELIVEGETGHTFEPDDAAEMGRAVTGCLCAGNTMGDRALQRAQTHYSIEAIADRYQDLYTRIMGAR